MIILAGAVRVASMEAAMPEFRRLVAATLQEKGCRDYSFSIDVTDDHVVRIFEMWEDEASLAAHMASPHFLAWRTASAGFGLSDSKFGRYDATAQAMPR